MRKATRAEPVRIASTLEDIHYPRHPLSREEALVVRARLLFENAPILEILRQGAHASEARRREDWGEPIRLAMSPVETRAVVQLAWLQYEYVLDQEPGQDLDAVRVLLDAQQFAADLRDAAASLGHPPVWRMLARHWRAGLAELRRSRSTRASARALARLVPEPVVRDLEEGSLASLSSEARSLLDRGIRMTALRLDWEPCSLDGGFALVVRFIECALNGDYPWVTRPGRWGILAPCFRVELKQDAIEAVEWLERSSARIRAAHADGPLAVDRVLTELDREQPGGANPFTGGDFPTGLYRSRYRQLAKLRLLAHALGAVPIEDDNWLGGALRKERTPAGERLWIDGGDLLRDVELIVRDS